MCYVLREVDRDILPSPILATRRRGFMQGTATHVWKGVSTDIVVVSPTLCFWRAETRVVADTAMLREAGEWECNDENERTD
jgi:hypothetical protein